MPSTHTISLLRKSKQYLSIWFKLWVLQKHPQVEKAQDYTSRELVTFYSTGQRFQYWSQSQLRSLFKVYRFQLVHKRIHCWALIEKHLLQLLSITAVEGEETHEWNQCFATQRPTLLFLEVTFRSTNEALSFRSNANTKEILLLVSWPSEPKYSSHTLQPVPCNSWKPASF